MRLSLRTVIFTLLLCILHQQVNSQDPADASFFQALLRYEPGPTPLPGLNQAPLFGQSRNFRHPVDRLSDNFSFSANYVLPKDFSLECYSCCVVKAAGGHRLGA
jgi:hypothetical protein